MTLRTRELGFLIPAALLGLLGIASVASARADQLDLGPLPGAAACAGLPRHARHAAVARHARGPLPAAQVGVLVAIGLVELDRINPALAADQAVWIAVGGAVFIAILLLLPDHRILERYRYLIGLTAVGLLVVTMVFGTRINGAKLWISIGGGQTVQLGEVSKVLVVVFLTAYLRDKRELLAIPTRRVMGVPAPPMAALGPVLLFLVAGLALVVVLNDFGTALLFLGIFLAMTTWPPGGWPTPASVSPSSWRGRRSSTPWCRASRSGSTTGCTRSPTRRGRATSSCSRSTRWPRAA